MSLKKLPFWAPFGEYAAQFQASTKFFAFTSVPSWNFVPALILMV